MHLFVNLFSIIYIFYHFDAVFICDFCHFAIFFLHWLQSIMFIFFFFILIIAAVVVAVMQFVYFLLKYKLIIFYWYLSDKTNSVIADLFNINLYFSCHYVLSFFINIIEFIVFFFHSVYLNFCMKLIILYNILTCSMNMISE